jgi:ribonuclease HI
MGKIHGYSDGACKKNPGPGGWGCHYVFVDDHPYVQINFVKFGGLKLTTNNVMELQGAINLLKIMPTGHDITMLIDNQYVIKGITSLDKNKEGFVTKRRLGEGAVFSGWMKKWVENEWKTTGGTPVKNKEHWLSLAAEFTRHLKYGSTIKIKWVKGHSGDDGNELADALANKGVPK